jgi:hypothetical protein
MVMKIELERKKIHILMENIIIANLLLLHLQKEID